MGKDWDNIGDSRQPGDPNYTDSTHNPYGRSKVRYGHGASYKSKNTGAGQQNWHMQWLNEAYRVLQGGGIIKAFSGTRTYHRLAAAMEQAGFVDIRLEAWCYGSGFPKSLNISKDIDRVLGHEPHVIGTKTINNNFYATDGHSGEAQEHHRKKDEGVKITAPSSPEAKTYEGWGTALKPAWEPVLVGRKPTL